MVFIWELLAALTELLYGLRKSLELLVFDEVRAVEGTIITKLQMTLSQSPFMMLTYADMFQKNKGT